MKRSITVLLSIIVIAFNLVLSQTFVVQGVLRDPAGRTVENGTHSVTFTLYDAQSTGTELWTETHGSVTTEHGVFSAELGNTSTLNALSFTNSPWLGISVDGGNEISPRMKLISSPSANALTGGSNIVPSTGLVGFGTTSPTAQVEVAGSGVQRMKVTSSDDQAGISFISSGDGEFAIYSPGSTNDLNFYNGSSDVMTLTETGNLGIGTTSPSTQLDVVGTAHVTGSIQTDDRLKLMRTTGQNYMDVHNGNNFVLRTMTELDGSVVNALTVEPSGDLGIGTEPTEKLEVAGNLKLSSGGALIFPDGTSLTSAALGGSASSLSTPGNALITADADAVGTGNIEFKTGSSTDMVITNERKVGIGTSTPTTHLEVSGSGAQRIKVASSDDNQAGISFKSGGTGEYVIYSSGGSDDLTFYNGTSDVMNLTAGGDLGIWYVFRHLLNCTLLDQVILLID